jgi:hypothetical protein
MYTAGLSREITKYLGVRVLALMGQNKASPEFMIALQARGIRSPTLSIERLRNV